MEKEEKLATEELDELHNSDSDKEYRKLKLRLEDLQNGKKKRYTLIAGIFSVAFFSAISLMVYSDVYVITVSKIVYSIVIGVLLGFCMALYVYILFDLQESKIRRKMLEYEAEDIKEEVQDDIFENSIKMSYKYLD